MWAYSVPTPPCPIRSASRGCDIASPRSHTNSTSPASQPALLALRLQDWEGGVALTGTVRFKRALRFQLVTVRGAAMSVVRDLPLDVEAHVVLDTLDVPVVIAARSVLRSTGSGWLEVALPAGWASMSSLTLGGGMLLRSAVAADGTIWVPVRTAAFPYQYGLVRVNFP